MKKRLLVCITIMLMLSSACENVKTTSTPRTSNPSNNSVENATVPPGVETSQTNTTSEPEPETDESIIPKNTAEYCSGVWTNLDSETETFFYGTWKVEKLLGFANSYNDASEYPTGQKIIGDEFIIKKDFFSSKGLKNYNDYQYELKNPLYRMEWICYNTDSFYRLFKINPDVLNINLNDKVKDIGISDSSTKLGVPLSFFIVNNDRLILTLEATNFELKKVTD
ncbi:hypothetical protein P9E76_20070 [Schinkia azotoformans]|uniref:Lipoprotein n=1 Tax=Schinkia azotoformans LMG 9581 TaxID=1131731 RepID=K6D3M8_SCHAZ|nr:hypothetical protein [Schinkia azotoformans]EKN67087.1 hypothetical protein BAZO_10508 [Schinkia azotoformans LMG 9581]MEC1640907.1 hypothetical protein [Schinkia azotoformans]MEC1722096.1 hypothetical protein [Schinkia azotoformans]MEC1947306.1 hypothetical protein [Schinkia azotoformans]MED4355033.1 hypothetical protein [Schinkia azotoformans]